MFMGNGCKRGRRVCVELQLQKTVPQTCMYEVLGSTGQVDNVQDRPICGGEERRLLESLASNATLPLGGLAIQSDKF